MRVGWYGNAGRALLQQVGEGGRVASVDEMSCARAFQLLVLCKYKIKKFY